MTTRITSMQNTILSKLGLSTEGSSLAKYWRVRMFSEYQGLSPQEVLNLLNKHAEISWIPVRKYGLEFEGGIPLIKEEFAEILNRERIPYLITGYNHDIVSCWKIGSDSSVSIPNLNSVEITSPQLIGLGNSGMGFVEVERLLEIWNNCLREHGFRDGVNRSCGGHVHVDVFDYSQADLFRLALLTYLSWDFLKFLIPPSRRNNSYCKPLNEEFFRLLLQNCSPDRYFVLNVQNFRNKHIEFRHWPGTLNIQKVRMHLLISLLLTETAKKEGIKKFYKEEVSFEEWLSMIGLKGPHPIMEEVRRFTEERFAYFLSREGVEPFTVNFSEKAKNLFGELLFYSLKSLFRRSSDAERVARSVKYCDGELFFRFHRKRWRAWNEGNDVEVLSRNSEVEIGIVAKARTIGMKIFELLKLFQFEEFSREEEIVRDESETEEIETETVEAETEPEEEDNEDNIIEDILSLFEETHVEGSTVILS